MKKTVQPEQLRLERSVAKLSPDVQKSLNEGLETLHERLKGAQDQALREAVIRKVVVEMIGEAMGDSLGYKAPAREIADALIDAVDAYLDLIEMDEARYQAAFHKALEEKERNLSRDEAAERLNAALAAARVADAEGIERLGQAPDVDLRNLGDVLNAGPKGSDLHVPAMNQALFEASKHSLLPAAALELIGEDVEEQAAAAQQEQPDDEYAGPSMPSEDQIRLERETMRIRMILTAACAYAAAFTESDTQQPPSVGQCALGACSYVDIRTVVEKLAKGRISAEDFKEKFSRIGSVIVLFLVLALFAMIAFSNGLLAALAFLGNLLVVYGFSRILTDKVVKPALSAACKYLLKPAVQALKGAAAFTWNALQNGYRKARQLVVEEIIPAAKNAWRKVGNFLGRLWSRVTEGEPENAASYEASRSSEPVFVRENATT